MGQAAVAPVPAGVATDMYCPVWGRPDTPSKGRVSPSGLTCWPQQQNRGLRGVSLTPQPARANVKYSGLLTYRRASSQDLYDRKCVGPKGPRAVSLTPQPVRACAKYSGLLTYRRAPVSAQDGTLLGPTVTMRPTYSSFSPHKVYYTV